MSSVGLSILLFSAFQTKGTASSYVRQGTMSCNRWFYGKEHWGQTATVKHPSDTNWEKFLEKFLESSSPDLSCDAGDTRLETSASNSTAADKKFSCLSNVTAKGEVVMINSSDLFSVVNDTGSLCCAVLFYARWCRFSAKAAPVFNALGRVIPDLQKFAVDMSAFSPLNSQLGIVSLPTLLFFKKGKVILRFNTTITLDKVADFVMYYTDLHPNQTTELEPRDYVGPVPSTVEEKTDFVLYFSIAFVLLVLARVMFVSRPMRVVVRWILHRFYD